MLFKLSPFTSEHIDSVKSFLDRWSGENFLSETELELILELSHMGNLNSSLLAWAGNELAGVRLTYAPGKLLGKVNGITPEKWNVSAEEVGYFKSLFVAEKYRGQGVGKLLSQSSSTILKEMGAKAILCHSWLESPENSSLIYLASMGFKAIKQHPNFWYDVDYQCVRCAPDRCTCTSVEMIKFL